MPRRRRGLALNVPRPSGELLLQFAQRDAPILWQWRWPAAFSADIDVGEMSLRAGLGEAGAKHADAVSDARRSEPIDHNAHLDLAREAQRREVGAAGLDNQADQVALVNVEQSRLD